MPGAARQPQSANAFDWCAGSLQLELDRWGDGSGIPAVRGWSYLTYNAHAAALRVDGGEVWSSNGAVATLPLVTLSITADPAGKLGRIVQTVPGLARIVTSLHGVQDQGCCSLAVQVEIQNLDASPHVFEWRWFHDTAFGEYQNCPSQPFDPDVDGGEVCLPGEVPLATCQRREFDALAAGAVGCGKSIGFRSADTGELGPVYVLDDQLNRPEVVEVLSWEDGALEPALDWSGLVDGGELAGCSGDDAVLVAWRVPPGSGTLAPGASGQLAWSIGQGCAPACCSLGADAGVRHNICEGQSVTLGGAPAAVAGVPPFSYRWLPDDGSLSDPRAANPLATPSATRDYQLEVRDAAGCLATAAVRIEVEPDLVPASVGNSLLAVRDAQGARLEWVPGAGAAAHVVLGASEKSFLPASRDASGLPGSSHRLAIPPVAIRFLRVVGVSCSGREGP